MPPSEQLDRAALGEEDSTKLLHNKDKHTTRAKEDKNDTREGDNDDDNSSTDKENCKHQPRHVIVDSPHDEFFYKRHKPWYSSVYLRPGSKFMGHQQSGQSTYNVEVEFKHVDMSRGFLCGYLRIEGLTETHPELTTYFEGEMINESCSFITSHKEWGATYDSDLSHWSRFQPWRQFADAARQPDYVHREFDQRNHIFMRWKECFLVPDATVNAIRGASYAGFYYICFDQIEGCISGFYYHQNWDKYQQLELTHKSRFPNLQTFEFR